MSLATVYSRAQCGIEAPLVTVETHLANGLPALAIVGLPEAAVRESRERVRAALQSCGFTFPVRRITINLAPADLPKQGGRYDLAIALGLLAASEQLPRDALEDHEIAGELGLSGEIRPVAGILPLALRCRDAGRRLILPAGNVREAALIEGLELLPVASLLEASAHLDGSRPLAPLRGHAPPPPDDDTAGDLAEVRGQAHAKRALEIAAAGGHNLLLMGPPGTGKTLLASRLPGILPPMDETEAMESAAIASISHQGFDPASWRRRPFRSPHHTASGVALVGGGSHPAPGEISLAHHGVLFLDELPEFDRRVLEVLREPLESGTITISRAGRQAEFPARFQLVAAMNPCPCGHLGDPAGRCRCTAEQVQRYRARLSGPLLDRIDMHVEVPPLPPGAWRNGGRNGGRDGEREGGGEASGGQVTSSEVRRRVVAARRRQLARAGKPNQRLDAREVMRHCPLDARQARLLENASQRLGLSARAYHRILKVARTIADLADAPAIETEHLQEAIAYRRLDRRGT